MNFSQKNKDSALPQRARKERGKTTVLFQINLVKDTNICPFLIFTWDIAWDMKFGKDSE
jgi:hypothetical protein